MNTLIKRKVEGKSNKENRLNNWVSLSLKICIWISLGLVIIGIAVAGLDNQKSIETLVPLDQLAQAIIQFNAAAIITLAILILLFTPVLQIMLAMVVLLREKDRIYSGICLLLLCVLAISIIVSLI